MFSVFPFHLGNHINDKVAEILLFVYLLALELSVLSSVRYITIFYINFFTS
jgi:hypothetical protein